MSRPKLHTILVICCIAAQALGAQAQQLAMLEPISQKTVTDAAIKPSSSRAKKRDLLDRLKQLDVSGIQTNEATNISLYRYAGLMTRMHLYPLAMKFFLRTLEPDSVTCDQLPFTPADEAAFDATAIAEKNNKAKSKGKAIKAARILETFNDGKTALAYALIFHVKQPVRGKAVVHRLAYTGHTFITLIKYNTDSSYTAISYGFAPRKDDLFSATPLEPVSSAIFRDDSTYPWDEVVGKFISRRRFDKILQLTSEYDGLAYHLSHNNCTDFGLKAAQLAGLSISNTRGSWLLGAGNNPGTTGESILLKKFVNTDTGNHQRLYIDTARAIPFSDLIKSGN